VGREKNAKMLRLSVKTHFGSTGQIFSLALFKESRRARWLTAKALALLSKTEYPLTISQWGFLPPVSDHDILSMMFFTDRKRHIKGAFSLDTVLFDTHAYVRRLQMGGFSSEQAEAHADALLFAMRGGTLTKIDIQEFEGRVKDEFHLQEKQTDTLRSELKEDIHSLDRKIEAFRSELKEDIHSLDGKIEAFRSELKEDIHSLRSELKEDIHSLRSELKEDIHSLRSELKEEIHSLRSELKEEINTSRREAREMETRMTLRFGLMLSAGLGLLLTLEKFLK